MNKIARDEDHTRRQSQTKRREKASHPADISSKEKGENYRQYAENSNAQPNRYRFKAEDLGKRERYVIKCRAVIIRRVVLIGAVSKQRRQKKSVDAFVMMKRLKSELKKSKKCRDGCDESAA